MRFTLVVDAAPPAGTVHEFTELASFDNEVQMVLGIGAELFVDVEALTATVDRLVATGNPSSLDDLLDCDVLVVAPATNGLMRQLLRTGAPGDLVYDIVAEQIRREGPVLVVPYLPGQDPVEAAMFKELLASQGIQVPLLPDFDWRMVLVYAIGTAGRPPSTRIEEPPDE